MDNDAFDKWEEERRVRRAERDARRAGRSRSENPTDDPEEGSRRSRRKERVLHTRISDDLDETLRKAAGEMRVPVSNLVRNVLEDVFDVVESVTDNVGDLVDDVLDQVDRSRVDFRGRGRHRHRRRRPSRRERGEGGEEPRGPSPEEREAVEAEIEAIEREAFPELLGWQPLILNRAQTCVDCGRDLAPGDRGLVGMGEEGLSDKYLCRPCGNARS